ncbi:hypothetical protein [Providencia manganoxydans]|uniref:hypothetical protein n=1 Tax=Providencia manganoxydans TaxID=2923283 RepID=UPI0034E602F2
MVDTPNIPPNSFNYQQTQVERNYQMIDTDARKRIDKLEADATKTKNSLDESLNGIKTDVEVIKSNYATTAALHKELTGLQKELSAQTKWIVGFMIGIAAISLTIAKLIF